MILSDQLSELSLDGTVNLCYNLTTCSFSLCWLLLTLLNTTVLCEHLLNRHV